MFCLDVVSPWQDVALGLSIVLSTLMSTVLFDFQISLVFIVGMCSVIYAAVLYSGNVDCGGMLPATAPVTQAPAPKVEMSTAAELEPLAEEQKNAHMVPQVTLHLTLTCDFEW